MSEAGKHFIIFSQEELDKIKNGEVVSLENCPWLNGGNFHVYFVSEEWMQEYDSTNNLP